MQWGFDWFFGDFITIMILMTVVSFIIFIVVFVVIAWIICRATKKRAQTQPIMFSQNVRPSRRERRILRESLPSECPECDAPLKYNEVRWVGPHRAECPYCGNVVELELTEVTESD